MNITRRSFLKGALATAVSRPLITCGDDQSTILGQGEFRYRLVPGWGVLDAETPVNNCHGIVQDGEGHIVLLTDHTKNNVIVYDKRGQLVHKWGKTFPGAHGLSIVTEGNREVLYITDLVTHRVTKTSLDGAILNEWRWPEESGKYRSEEEFKPSWTLHLPDGGFFVLDGYGRDYITHYGPDGRLVNSFGGQEGGITHWGPHGGMIDIHDPAQPKLLIAMSDQQYLLRLSTDGKEIDRTPLPGGNPRQIRRKNDHYFVAHLADNWPQDRNSRGFISVLDANLRVVSNLAGSPPIYNDRGELEKMRHQEAVFIHPHDLIVDDEDSIYVAQFASGQTYPIKLERV